MDTFHRAAAHALLIPLLKTGRGNVPLLGEHITATHTELALRVHGAAQPPCAATLMIRKGFPLHYAFISLVLTPKVMLGRRWGDKSHCAILKLGEYGKEQQKEGKVVYILRVCAGALSPQPVHKRLHLKTSSLPFSHSSMRNVGFATHEMESLRPDKIEGKSKLPACASRVLLNKFGLPVEDIPERGEDGALPGRGTHTDDQTQATQLFETPNGPLPCPQLTYTQKRNLPSPSPYLCVKPHANMEAAGHRTRLFTANAG